MTRRRPDPRRPGNVVLRRRRIQRETVQTHRRPRLRAWVRFRPSPWWVAFAFAALIALGTLLLSLPISSESGGWTSGWDALFTATSAVCVTGLATVDTSTYWSGFGEGVILGLFQAGGLGVTMYTGALLLVFGRRFGLRGREFFGMELAGAGDFDVHRLLRRVMIFVVIVEGTTFLLLVPWFVLETDVAAPTAVWRALFHTVSAFNNAGFDVMGDFQGFSRQIDAAYPLVVLGIAAFLGSVSFVTVFDLRRPRRNWTLDTRIVVLGMGGFLLLGMVIFLAGEVQSGRVLDGLGPLDAIANAFFLSVNRTTGMSTIDMGAVRDSTTAGLLFLMFVGGASTSTAGGIKLGAFAVSIAVVVSSLRGRHRAELFGRELPQAIVLRGLAVALLGVLLFALGVWALETTESHGFRALAFEAMSALANVGWSEGVTPTLTTGGMLILVVLMFVGRIGPLMVALTVPERSQAAYRYPQEGVRVG